MSKPFIHPTLNQEYQFLQRRWLQLPFRELSADSSLSILLARAQIMQQSFVDTLCIHPLVFNDNKILVVPGLDSSSVAVGAAGTWTVPHVDLVVPAEIRTTKIRVVAVRILHDELTITCDPDSAYLMAAALPTHKVPIVAVVIRLEAFRESIRANTPQGAEWFTRQQVHDLANQQLRPPGLKRLIEKAFAQKQFEKDALAG